MVCDLEIKNRSQPMLQDQHLLTQCEDLPVVIIMQQTKTETR